MTFDWGQVDRNTFRCTRSAVLFPKVANEIFCIGSVRSLVQNGHLSHTYLACLKTMFNSPNMWMYKPKHIQEIKDYKTINFIYWKYDFLNICK